MDILIISLLSVLCFFQRYHIALSSGNDFDTFGHLFFVKCINQKKGSLWQGVSRQQTIGEGFLKAPLLLHWFLSFLPYGLLFKWQKAVNPLVDAFGVFILGVVSLSTFNEEYYILAQLLYIFTPSMFSSISTGPRVRSFTPRIFSEVMANISLLLIFFFLQHDNNIFIIIVLVITFMLLLLISKFGTQVVVFYSLFFLLFNYKVFIILLTSFTLVLIISRGKYKHVLLEQFEHLKYYFRRNIKGLMAISKRNSIKNLYFLFKKKNYKELFFEIIARNSITSLCIKSPLFLLVIYLLIFHNDVSFEEQYNTLVFYKIFIIGFVLFLTTSTNFFIFLGESERYLYHIIMPAILILSAQLEYAVYFLIAYGIIYYLFEVRLSKIFLAKDSYEDEVVKYLNNDGYKSVMSIPYHAGGGWRLIANSDMQWLYPVMWDKDTRESFSNKYEEKYPFIKKECVESIVHEYGIDSIILDKEKTDFHEVDYQKVYENNRYIVFSLK